MNKSQSRLVFMGVLLLVSVGLLILNQGGALTPVKNALAVPFSGMQRGVSNLWARVHRLIQPDPEVEALRQQITDLQQQVAQLSARNLQLEENEAAFSILSQLVGFASKRTDLKYLAANVIGFDTSSYLGFIFLDRGSNDGITRDMPVVTEAGLVGHVVEVTSSACKVLLITDPNSPVNARVERSRDTGVVVGQQTDTLQMQYLAQDADVKPGDLIVSSGLGGKYPEGLVLGTVTVVNRQDYEVQQTASLVSGVNFRSLEIVLIVTSFQPVDFTPFTQSTPTP